MSVLVHHWLQLRSGVVEGVRSFIHATQATYQAWDASRRYAPLDTARGMCLLWMMTAHIVSTGAAQSSWLRFLYLPGWATTNFVMLTGFALALRTQALEKTRGRRAVKLLLIAYVSNVVFNFLKTLVAGHSITSSEILSHLLLEQPWTISAILLPTAALIAIAGGLEKLIRACGAPAFLMVITILSFALFGAIQSISGAADLFASLFVFENARFGFPLGSLFALGIWAYALGAVFRAREERPNLWLTTGFLILLHLSATSVAPITYLYRFGMTLFFALALSNLPRLGLFRGWLGNLGRSSLLVFILHRIILQAERIGLGFLPLPILHPFMLVSTFLLCAWVCEARERNPTLSRHLRTFGF